jgi:hypothetical protein
MEHHNAPMWFFSTKIRWSKTPQLGVVRHLEDRPLLRRLYLAWQVFRGRMDVLSWSFSYDDYIAPRAHHEAPTNSGDNE